MSGSDCANCFFWDKNTEAIVQWMPGDEIGVVNCLEPHPAFPILATSGMDPDVKIWVPSCEITPTLEGLNKCVHKNVSVKENYRSNNGSLLTNDTITLFVRQCLRTRPLRHTVVPRTAASVLEDDDDELRLYDSAEFTLPCAPS